MPRLVKDWGSKDSKIILIGEAPGREEDRVGKPFAGNTGRMLFNEWLARPEIGIKREECYITNVYPMRPPNNQIWMIPKKEIEEWTEKLHERLAELTDPWLIVPMGNYALQAIMRKSGVKITDYRGSILRYWDENGRKVKVIPTLHPANTFYQRSNLPLCLMDWQRIAKEREFKALRLPKLTLTTHPTHSEAAGFVRDCESYPDVALAVDIETNPKEKKILMVGFSLRPYEAITFPWTREWIPTIKRLCEGKNPKVLQHGTYDAFWLAGVGITLENWRFDLLPMHHILYPGLDHDLGVQASLDIRMPFWKKDAKTADAQSKVLRTDYARMPEYNGKDCCGTRQLLEVHLAHLKRRGKLDFYFDHYADLLPMLAGIMHHGIQVDEKKRKQLEGECYEKCKGIEEELEKEVGYSLKATKSLSNAKIMKYLYEDLGLRKVYKTRKNRGVKKRTLTIDEVTLRKMQLRYPEHQHVINLILAHRENLKMAGSLKDERVDGDGRMRFSLGFDTATGRLNSTKSPQGTGSNSQNIDRRSQIRSLYVPDDGCVLLEFDMSQIEGRIVYALTGDLALLKEARSKPWMYDMHTKNAATIFEHSVEWMKRKLGTGKKKYKDMRYLGKKAVHASQRGMMGEKLSEELLKEGYIRTPSECQRMIDNYLSENAAIPEVYFRRCREIIMRYRKMTNSWGRDWVISWDWLPGARIDVTPLNDETYRKAYSFLPQSECADLVNQYGLKPLWNFIKRKKLKTRINLHVHDALVMSCPPEEVYRVMKFVWKHVQESRWFSMNYVKTKGVRPKDAVEVSIPVEFKIGSSWAAEFEFKRLPEKEEVEAACRVVMEKIAGRKRDERDQRRKRAA